MGTDHTDYPALHGLLGPVVVDMKDQAPAPGRAKRVHLVWRNLRTMAALGDQYRK